MERIAVILLWVSIIVIAISWIRQSNNIDKINQNVKHQQELINKLTWDAITQWDILKELVEDITRKNAHELVEKDFNEKVAFLSEKLQVPKECFQNQFDGWTFFRLEDNDKCQKYKSKFTNKDSVEFSIYEETSSERKVNILDYNYNEVQ